MCLCAFVDVLHLIQTKLLVSMFCTLLEGKKTSECAPNILELIYFCTMKTTLKILLFNMSFAWDSVHQASDKVMEVNIHMDKFH